LDRARYPGTHINMIAVFGVCARQLSTLPLINMFPQVASIVYSVFTTVE